MSTVNVFERAKLAGGRIRRSRIEQGVSIRDLASQAGLSKTSIVNLESGKPVRKGTLEKVCEVLGVELEVIVRSSLDENDGVVVHRHENDVWYDLHDFEHGPWHRGFATPDKIAEINRSGCKVPVNILTSRLEQGVLKPTVMELFAPSERRSHRGEEMVFVIEGTLLLSVGEHDYVLKEGESATFYSVEQHSYAPEPQSPTPVRVLSIRVDR